MKKTTAAAGLCAAAAAVLLAGSRYAYHRAFHSPLKDRSKTFKLPHGEQYEKEAEFMESLISEMSAIPYEQVYTTSFDGLKLAARYYHVSDDTPIHIQVHGYHGSAVRDFSGGNKLVRELGCSTLVVDQRAHGKSEGITISFGINERHDLVSWIHYCRERFGKDRPIVISGVSMGATTVLMAAGMELPDNVIGVMADCPYSSPKEIICKVCGDMKLPPKLMYPFIYLGAKLFGKFDLTETSADEAVKYAKIPVLLIHGEDDLFVPCDMSRKIHKNCASDIIFETFPGAGHGLSYIVNPELYRQRVLEALALMENSRS